MICITRHFTVISYFQMALRRPKQYTHIKRLHRCWMVDIYCSTKWYILHLLSIISWR